MILVNKSKDKIPDYLDDEDYLATLSTRKGRLSHTKVQRISYILSKLTKLKGKFTAHYCVIFSDTIMKKILTQQKHLFCEQPHFFFTLKGTEIYAIARTIPDTRKRDR